MKEWASAIASRYLPKQTFRQIREQYRQLEKRLHPLKRRWYGSFDSADLVGHLKEQLNPDFEVLMVHSSVNHMQPCFSENPLAFVRAMMDFVGPDRTLVMPAFYFGDPAIGGAYKTFLERPRFDVRRTPSQMGLATELFRRMPEVVHSRHPVYRLAARGPLAADLVRGHESGDGAFAAGSPFAFMDQRETVILGIGKSIDVITHVHFAEAVMGDRFPVPRGAANPPLALTLVDGDEEIPMIIAGSGFRWSRNMLKLRKLATGDSLRVWLFQGVPLFAARARQLTADLVSAAERGQTLYDGP